MHNLQIARSFRLRTLFALSEDSADNSVIQQSPMDTQTKENTVRKKPESINSFVINPILVCKYLR